MRPKALNRQTAEKEAVMFKRILFPVDFSKNAEKIMPFVSEMAGKFGAEIHCVHSLHVSTYYANIGMAAAYVAEFEMRTREEVEKKLDTFVATHFKGYKVTTAILTGRPGDQIVAYAGDSKIDLIIMGHSTTGLERAIMGSVAAHVVKYAPAPVLVISPETLKG